MEKPSDWITKRSMELADEIGKPYSDYRFQLATTIAALMEYLDKQAEKVRDE